MTSNFEHKKSSSHLGRVLILGKGVTGSAVYDYLIKQPERYEKLDIVDDKSLDLSCSYDLAIASPGISEFSHFYQGAKSISREIISEIEFAWRESELKSTWVAITGTNGKTTTTALVAFILRQAGKNAIAVGNIGEASISHVDGNEKIYVAECSSYQLASCIDFKPEAVAILNITPDHLSWHKSYENYRKAKFKLLIEARPNSNCLIYLDDSLANEADIEHACAKVVTPKTSDWADQVREIAPEMKIKGEHNIKNAICASEICGHLGCDNDEIRTGLLKFAPLPHRIEPCGEIEGIEFYNDSKATNVDATLKALTAFQDKRVVLLLGGKDKGSDLEPLVSAVENSTVRSVILYGQAAPRFEEAFQQGTGLSETTCLDMKSAVDQACLIAERGDVVLLSPACASFDEFSNFEERGDSFKSMVTESMKEKACQ